MRGGHYSTRSKETYRLRSYASNTMQQLANADDFSINTLDLYTKAQDSGSPTWSITNGALTIGTSAAGLQAVLLRNSFVAANCYVEVVTGQQQDGGIVLRYQNQNNFYLLALSDDSGAQPGLNMILYKRVAGAFTNLGSANLTWPRGSNLTFRLTATGSSIVASMGGVAMIAVTDSAITAAGRIGVRSNAAAFDAWGDLRWG